MVVTPVNNIPEKEFTEVPVEVQLVDLWKVCFNVLLALRQELCEVLKCWFYREHLCETNYLSTRPIQQPFHFFNRQRKTT